MQSAWEPHGTPILLALAVGSLLVCSSTPAQSAPDDSGSVAFVTGAVTARQDPNRVTLGRLLFHDPRLSKNRAISCSTCHVLSRFGIDGKQISTGAKGVPGRRNTPSVFNGAMQVAQYWDGRAVDVEAQAVSAIRNPLEMAMPSEQAVVKVLSRVPRYVELFQKAFPGDQHAVSLNNVGEAIGAFERGLVTNSRWDKFVEGDRSALTVREKQGQRLFMQRGCIVCHAGPQVGGTSFQKVGATYPWPNQGDQGRVEITQFAPDRMVFKVPSLKNVAETAPYFHDGSASNLEVAIRLMGYHQLGIEMADDDVRAIAEWLRSMTGEPDPMYIAVPQLPPG
jgi:cytochrome c peroxidase